MIGSQVIDNGYHDSKNMIGNIPGLPRPHSLEGVVLRYLGETLQADKKQLQKSFIGMSPSQTPTQEQMDYAMSDVKYLIPLFHAQEKHIKERGLQHIINMENKLTPVLVKIEFKGCLIDRKKHKDNIINWKKKLTEIEGKLDQIVIKLSKDYPRIQGGRFTNTRRKEELVQLDMFGGDGYVIKNLNLYNVNYSSPKQIEDLFTRTGAVKPTDDDGKISFGENAINTYTTNNPDSVLKEFVEVLLEYREYSKLLSTYGGSFFRLVDRNGRMRTHYGQTFTDTARLNSAAIIKDELGTNLANIPKRADIRSIFVSDPGYSFVDIDMTGQELLLAGDLSKEPIIMKAFKEGFDLHSYLSSISYSIVFNNKIEIKNEKIDITVDGFQYNLKALRDDHKSCIFSKVYLGGAKRVQNILNRYLVNHWPAISRFDKAMQVSKAIDNAIPILTKYLKGKVSEVQKNGFVISNKLGRRRYFDERDKAYGDAANFPIQSTGSDSIKIALINIDKWLSEKAKQLKVNEEEVGWLTLSIYDENVVCLNDKYLKYAEEISKIMSDSITYFLEDLTGSSEMKICKYWNK